MGDPTRSRKGRVKLTVEIPEVLLKRVRRLAREEERDLWRIVKRALERYVEEAETRKEGGGTP
jgi:predicted transcriptional regulator